MVDSIGVRVSSKSCAARSWEERRGEGRVCNYQVQKNNNHENNDRRQQEMQYCGGVCEIKDSQVKEES